MTQEALKLALEALDCIYSPLHVREISKVGAAMAAIKEALRENAMREVQRLGQEIEQEPDVQETLHWHAFNYRQAHIDQAHEMWEKLEQFVDYKIKASQRTWVGLTDDEENEYNYLGPDMHWVIQEIAAKLKERNA